MSFSDAVRMRLEIEKQIRKNRKPVYTMSNDILFPKQMLEDLLSTTKSVVETIRKIQEAKQEQLSKRDWEILKLQIGYSDHIIDANKSDGSASHYPIHSVRRLSDGEIFVLGDDFTWNKGVNHGRIERFEISKNNGNMLAVHFSGGVGINNISKAKKKVLFTTIDGKNVYDGDDYYFISSTWDVLFTGDKFNWVGTELKAFSTKEAAEEFVLLNRPMLSLEDLISEWGDKFDNRDKDYYKDAPLFLKFKKLAKSKMDGKK